MAELTGGQAVVAALKAEGIDAVFGIVGTHNVAIFDALYDAPELRLVVPRHEQGASMMADGYARASGRLAACVTVPGPGLTNALTGVGQAYSDSSPLLLISAQINSRSGVPVLEAVTFGIFSEVQRTMSNGVSGIRHAWSGYVGLRHVKQENDALKRDLAAAQIAAQEQRALASRARGLEKLLELRDRTSLQTAAAEIIGTAPAMARVFQAMHTPAPRQSTARQAGSAASSSDSGPRSSRSPARPPCWTP